MTKYISFSLSKANAILTYSVDGKEINAVIDPYTFCTYLMDLGVLEGRMMAEETGELWVKYFGSFPYWKTWRDFIVAAKEDYLFNDKLLQKLSDRHAETETIKTLYLTLNN